MQDLGGRLGMEAVVQPEMTRTQIVEMIKSGELKNIVFIHRIEDGFVDDMTTEMLDLAEGELKAEAMNKADRIAYRHDHERELAKVTA